LEDIAASPTGTATAFPTETMSPSRTVFPTDTPTRAPTACPDLQGTIQSARLETNLQEWPVDLYVYLPSCYDAQKAAGYPLLILLHGQTFTLDQWVHDGLLETADRLIAAGEIRPLIIVLPNESHTERDPSVSHFDVVVADAVLPWIDSHYNTCADRIYRAVGGISRGAGWAVHIGFLRPGLFGSVGAHSLPPFIGDANRLEGWLAGGRIGDLPRLYLDMGDHDYPGFVKANEEFRAVMTELGVPYEWHWNAGGHDNLYWSAHVEDYLRWYNRAWAEAP
jgi:enterochelin esterase-like enzyme